jgi:hypothetical protein
MTKIFLIIALLFSTSIFAKDKYLIYFKDKGNYSEQTLVKVADLEEYAKNFISEKSIERRKKSYGKAFLKYEDLPLEISYLNRLKKNGIKIVHKLKWFNAVSAYLTQNQLNLVKNEAFVNRTEKVKKVKYLIFFKYQSKNYFL